MPFTERDDADDERTSTGDSLSRTVDKLGNSPFSALIVVLCLLATVGLWALVLGSPSTTSWVVDGLISPSDTDGDSGGGAALFVLFGIPFGLPFIATYLIARSRHPDIEEESRIETGMMAGYAYRQRGDRRWRIWILSGMVGGLNFLLLFLIHSMNR